MVPVCSCDPHANTWEHERLWQGLGEHFGVNVDVAPTTKLQGVRISAAWKVADQGMANTILKGA